MENKIVNLADFLVVIPSCPPNSKLCMNPEDIAAAEAINRDMEIVVQKANACFAYSERMARDLIFRSRV